MLSLTLPAWTIRPVRAFVLREMEKGYINGLMSRGVSTGSVRADLVGKMYKGRIVAWDSLQDVLLGAAIYGKGLCWI